jgi:thiol-disulfide isomerase/thioredoxin
MDDRPFRIADQRGRVTLLNFWGTWCPPCREEIPHLVEIDARYRGRGVDLIGITLAENDGAKGLRRFANAHGLRYRQTLATDAVLEAFDDIHAVPVSVLIDQKGRIRYRWEGERDAATFAAAIKRLLREG